MEPVIRPLGFNWKIGIGLITSLAAREVIVGTLGNPLRDGRHVRFNGVADSATERSHTRGSGRSVDFLCVRDAVLLYDSGSAPRDRRLEMAAIQFAYMTVLAYAGALAANQIITRILAT